jgi:heme/copper-type cytochrome/quinol oxidase subunit 3
MTLLIGGAFASVRSFGNLCHRGLTLIEAVDPRPRGTTMSADSQAPQTRIVILGGGFGGVYIARHLERLCRGRRVLLAWGATIGLGILFLLGTAYEWRQLIVEHQLTISRNLFGSTFFTLVGFHALHVTIGILMMLGLVGLILGRQLSIKDAQPVQLVSWYWHFVDGVWIVVFTIVYLERTDATANRWSADTGARTP